MFISMSFIFLAWVGYVLLSCHNLQVLLKTKNKRLEARRAYKKEKNERLKKFYGLNK